MQLLTVALRVPPSTNFLIAAAADGRSYLSSLGEIQSALRLEDPYRVANRCYRAELLHAHLVDASPVPLNQYLKEVAFARVVDALMTELINRADCATDVLMDEALLSKALHRFGVNLCCLHAIYDICCDRLKALTSKGPSKVLEQAVVDKQNTKALNTIQRLCAVEEVGRVLKVFVRCGTRQQADAAANGTFTVEDHTDVVNRVAYFTVVSKEKTSFWADHVLPAIRKKFQTASDFSLALTDELALGALGVMARGVRTRIF